MPEGRPEIPAALKREVLMETGFACAIPACRETTTEMSHIIPWGEVHVHEFDNLIPLCPNHHTRYDKGEIDRKAVLQYKANLAVLNGRYSDLERRVLQGMDDLRKENANCRWLLLPGGMTILMSALLDDGIVKKVEIGGLTHGPAIPVPPPIEYYELTDKGDKFLDRWLGADPLL